MSDVPGQLMFGKLYRHKSRSFLLFSIYSTYAFPVAIRIHEELLKFR